jgi:hypothetical protein
MSAQATRSRAQARSVRANGIDIHYLEQGEGDPLLVLHGGMVSTDPIWEGIPARTRHTWTRSPRTSA